VVKFCLPQFYETCYRYLPMNPLNGLALEYQRDYGTAHGNLNVFNLVNNPAANSKCSVFGLGFEEELSNRILCRVSCAPR
jgi:hypothetical protein